MCLFCKQINEHGDKDGCKQRRKKQEFKKLDVDFFLIKLDVTVH